jgi:hypothetical protein
MILKIVDLKYAFDNLYSYLQIYSDDETVKSVAKQLNELNSLFAKMKETSIGKTTVKQEANGNLVLGGGSKLNIDNNLFTQLKKEVFKLRKKMINNF